MYDEINANTSFGSSWLFYVSCVALSVTDILFVMLQLTLTLNRK